jgi:hypothetical protein
MVAGFAVAIVADELGHRPRLKHGAMGPELGEVADEEAHQFAFALPKRGKEMTFFFGSQEVGGEDRLRGVDLNSFHGRRFFGAALHSLGFHCRVSLE